MTEVATTDPNPWATIPELVDGAAARYGATEALSDGDVRLTFAELAERVHEVARALIASGVQAGDRVAIWAPNVAEWVIAALGVHAAGAVMVPINTRFKGEEAAYVLRRSRARLLFTASGFLGIDYVGMLVGEEGLDALGEIVVLRGDAPAGTVPFAAFLARAASVSEEQRALRTGAVRGDDLCHVLFTSGTTGTPKGVMLEHGAVCSMYWTLANVFEMERGERQLVVLPFFHSFGLHVGILCSLMKGLTIVPHLVFEVDEVMRRVADERITILPGPPTIFQAILDSPRRAEYDLSSVRSITIGGAGFPPQLVERIHDELGVDRVQSGYGLTECSGTVSLSSPPATAEVIAHTAGRPLPGIEVRIVDDAGVDVAPGEPGEILVRGFAVMRGYLDDAAATAAVIDGDGWLHTGDVGLFRGDGNLVVTDRKKDMYTIGGFNAYPAEIETVLSRHPAVAQVAVIGVPDDLMGEVGMAFVVPAAGRQVDAREIVRFAREHMANYKVPRTVEIVDALPLNATGKVVKPELRRRAAERARLMEPT